MIKLIVLVCMLAGHIACKSRPKNQLKSNVEPPGKTSDLGYSAGEIAVFNDLLSGATYNKQIKQTVETEFWTSSDETYVKTKSKQAFQSAIIKSLTNTHPGQQTTKADSFLTRFKQDLIQSVIANFIKTLKVYKIVNGIFQYDVHFIAEEDSPLDYSPEMASNQLIDISQVATLTSRIAEAKDATKIVKKIKHLPNILPPISGDSSMYQYLGGTVSIWVSLLAPKFLPTLTKNALNGFVRYRRYFRVNHLPHLALNADRRLHLDKAFWHADKPQDQIVTVDIIKTFNLQTMKPQLNTLEISFGQILNPRDHQGKWWSTVYRPARMQDGQTGFLKLVGKVAWQAYSIDFQLDMQKLVYRFDRRQMDLIKSATELEFTHKQNITLAYDDEMREDVNRTVKEILFDRLGNQFISLFQLSRFYQDLTVD